MTEERPRPKKRRPRAELKELMLQGGVEVLAAHGIEMQISSVSYARVFEHLEDTRGVRITYGSVHERIWDSLQEYQLAVIERAGLWDSSTSRARPRAAVQEAIDAAETAAPADRPHAAREVWRRFANDAVDAGRQNDDWGRYLKTVVTMSTQPRGTLARDAAVEGARKSYADLEARARERLSAGLALGSGTGGAAFPADADLAAILARVSIAVAEGLDLRRTLTEDDEPTLLLRTGPNGELQEWNHYGVAMWAIVHACTEARSGDGRPS
ncbi:MAG: hypothetical protein R8F63_14790 [Acidimicrobiales bacterium]|nr:hypothetical protein [Acidimicrobiales bacterium]